MTPSEKKFCYDNILRTSQLYGNDSVGYTATNKLVKDINVPCKMTPTEIVSEKPFAPPMPKIDSVFNQGYTQALLNLQKHINQDLYDDMRKHKMPFNSKNIQALTQCFIENRQVLRDFPTAFIRVEKDEKGKPYFKVYIK